MASAMMTNSSLSAPTNATDWSDFINVIGTAAGPLITLFGEQATKQFVSMSRGWADNILLATGPIGIITIIVSAIRIGGPPWLKSLIGRSRESRASAEQEFLSSTSEEVCELWSGRGVVRVTDKANDMKLLLILYSAPENLNATLSTSNYERVLSAGEAFEQDVLVIRPDPRPEIDSETIKEIILGIPNITVNIRGNILHATESGFWAFLGVLLQSLTLAFPAIATYHWKWLRKGIVVPPFAYGCFLAGSVSVLVGILGCGHIIESSTTEYTFRKSTSERRQIQRILRLQMKCTVGAQQISSFAILNYQKDPVIRASTLNNKKYSFWAAVYAFAAVTGFIVQFIGLGVLHWSATVIVLGSSLIMTGIRAFVRRGLAGTPLYTSVPDDFELAWLALRISRDDWDNFLFSKAPRDLYPFSRDYKWGVLTGYFEPLLADLMRADHNFVGELKELSKQEFVLGFNISLNQPLDQCDEVKAVVDLISAAPNIPLRSYGPVASKLAVAIEGVMDVLGSASDLQWKEGWRKSQIECDWRIDVSERLDVKTSWIVRLGHRTDGGSLAQDLTAGLSLWIYSHLCGKTMMNDTGYAATQVGVVDRVQPEVLTLGEPTSFSRIIGNSELSTLEELSCWIPAVQQQRVPCTTIAVCYGMGDGKAPEPHDKDCRFRPIFGLYNSASLKMQVRPSADRPQTETHTEAAFTFRSPADLANKQDFIVIPDPAFNTIEITCALEVFSLFMLSICICIENVGGETTKDAGFKSNSVFTALAKKLIDSGLIREGENHDAYSEALLYIIPAFARFGLLPD